MASQVLATAFATGSAVRLHARDGEVLIAQILELDADGVRFVVLTSSRPERYAVCDSTGFHRRFDEIERAVLVSAVKRR